MITAIFTSIQEAATQAMSLISGLFTSVVNIVWSGEAITPIGLLILIPIGVGVVFFAINFLFKLVNKIKVGKRG